MKVRSSRGAVIRSDSALDSAVVASLKKGDRVEVDASVAPVEVEGLARVRVSSPAPAGRANLLKACKDEGRRGRDAAPKDGAAAPRGASPPPGERGGSPPPPSARRPEQEPGLEAEEEGVDEGDDRDAPEEGDGDATKAAAEKDKRRKARRATREDPGALKAATVPEDGDGDDVAEWEPPEHLGELSAWCEGAEFPGASMPVDVYEERMFEASGGLEGYALRAMNEMDHYDELERRTHAEAMRDVERGSLAEGMRELKLRLDHDEDEWSKLLELNMPPKPEPEVAPTIAPMFDDSGSGDFAGGDAKTRATKRSPRLPSAAQAGERVVAGFPRALRPQVKPPLKWDGLGKPPKEASENRDPMRVGVKRNWLANAAMGQIVAHFDDDDLYAPTYVERMVKALDSKKADLVKLSAFYYYDVLDDPDWLYRYDADDDMEAGRHLRRWSYGFSFVYRSELADSVGFHDDGWCGEDYDLATRAARLGYRCGVVDDADRRALHMRHRSNAIATPIFRSDGEYGVRMRGRVVQRSSSAARRTALEAHLARLQVHRARPLDDDG
ncbi:hypothetical protein JL720_3435 [Aureococcus anophagefferens]|nr:hypothetical protein JL720_3435 [Aureococcus anophagefferens]